MRALRGSLLAVVTALVVAGPAPAVAQGPIEFIPVTPCRLVDTRVPSFAPALAAGTTRSFTVRGVCGVPLTAIAAFVNVTAVTPTSQGHLRVFPSNVALPNISTINFPGGITALANGAIVSLNTNATPDLSVFTFLVTAGGSVHLVLDVTGFFAEFEF